MPVPVFESFAARKIRTAEHASIHRLLTVEDHSSRYPLETIGNNWTRQLYDGPFHVPPAGHTESSPSSRPPGTGPAGSRTSTVSTSPSAQMPTVSLVFVQSKDGNTGANDPAELGGGATDKHLIYEGLSRVAADAVLAGATTAAGEDVFFSVWHPELVALRLSLGLERHPAQVVLTGRACIDPDASLVFNVPQTAVIVIGSAYACTLLSKAAASRSWMHVVEMDGQDIRPALRRLASEFGIRRISCIGGRTTATTLLDAGLVQDICLTTTPKRAGEPATPFYVGNTPPVLKPIVRKRCTDPDAAFLFEHLRVLRRPV